MAVTAHWSTRYRPAYQAFLLKKDMILPCPFGPAFFPLAAGAELAGFGFGAGGGGASSSENDSHTGSRTVTV